MKSGLKYKWSSAIFNLHEISNQSGVFREFSLIKAFFLSVDILRYFDRFRNRHPSGHK